MKKKLIVPIALVFTFILFVNSAMAEKVLVLMFTVYKNDTIFINEIGYYDTNIILPISGDYKIEILDDRNEILYSVPFDVKFHILTEPPMEVNESLIYVRLPWQEKFSTVRFYHLDKLMHTVNLSDYLCNNNHKCESEKGESVFLCPMDCSCGNDKCDLKFGESYENCPVDCPSGSKDNYCDKVFDGICDPDCRPEDDADCLKAKTSLWIYVAIGAVIAALIFVIILLSRRVK